MGYDKLINKKEYLINRIEYLYEKGIMPKNQYDKFSTNNWKYLIENLYRLEQWVADNYPLK